VKKLQDGYEYTAVVIPYRVGVLRFPSASLTVNSVIDRRVSINLQPDYLPYQDYSDFILLGFLIVFTCVGYIVRKRWQKNKATIIPAKLTIDQKYKLWAETAELFQKDAGDIKTYYYQTSEKLKFFFDRVLGFDTAEKTSLEVKEQLRNITLEGKDIFLTILETADWVKFAKYIPPADEQKEYRRLARQFLELHKPVKNEVAGNG
jgi:hypothetical protein